MRANLQIRVGTYTGDGTDNRSITGVGFRPDVVIIKGGANHSVVRTSAHVGDATSYMANNVANFADAIQQLMPDGFQLGTDATVNANGTVYYWIALRGASAQNYLRTGIYTGNGSDDRNYTAGGLGFTPDFAFIACNSAQTKIWRSNTMLGDSTAFFGGNVNTTNLIQSFLSGGFQLGTAANANGNGVDMFFFCLKAFAGAIKFGSYLGNGIDATEIKGIGFRPDIIILKNGDSSGQGRIRTSSMGADSVDVAFPMGAATSGTDWIERILADGFRVGASGNINAQTHHYVAIKAGDFNVPLIRLTS